MGTIREILRSLSRRVLPDRRFRSVAAEHLRAPDDPVEQRTLFARSVNLVEVEVHSFCNRTCWFCPNVFIDRRSETRYLDEGVYLRLLEDLHGIDYAGVFTFSRYCEPFADEVFYIRLEQASRRLPDACLHTNTNGDFLTDEALRRAGEAGLRRLYIQLYLAEEESFTPGVVTSLAERVRRRIPSVTFRPGRSRSDWIEYTGGFGRMTIRMYARDFRANGVNRCGLKLTPPRRRTSPCFRPFTDVYVDYNGSVMPCCNLRSDHPSHVGAIWGQLDVEPGSVFRIFAGRRAADWRKRLITFSPKSFPCEDCTFDVVPDTSVNRRQASRIRKRFASLVR